MIDAEWLQSWVRPRHLAEPALEGYRHEFLHHPAKCRVIPDFLHEETAGRLHRFLAADVEWERKYRLYSDRDAPGATSREAWEAAGEADRFFRFHEGRLPPGKLTPNVVEYIRLSRALADPRTLAFFAALCGTPLEGVALTLHGMGDGDFLRPHRDAVGRRRIAFVLYLSPDWLPAYGGELRLRDWAGTVTTLRPAFNSLAVFDVLGHDEHWVEPIATGSPVRYSIGGWFGSPPATP